MTGQHHTKVELRTRLLERRRALSKETVARASHEASLRLAGLPEWQSAEFVAVYSAVRGEIDPAHLWDLRRGQRLAFPVVVGPRSPLAFYLVEAPSDLVPGPYGIPSPDPAHAQAVPLSALDLLVIPGVGFDREGHRLGLGKGYYDRTLPLLRTDAIPVGLAHAWQLIAAVPTDPWDRPMRLVVTDLETWRPTRAD